MDGVRCTYRTRRRARKIGKKMRRAKEKVAVVISDDSWMVSRKTLSIHKKVIQLQLSDEVREISKFFENRSAVKIKNEDL